jgi:aminoglycoside phosphotransferase family enzyme
MAEIRTTAQLLEQLENGELADDLRKEVRELVAYLHEHAGSKGKAKGSLTLKIDFNVQGSSLTFETDIATKKPKKLRGSTTLFCNADGAILTGHPKQDDLPFGPRAVPKAGE